MSERKLIRLSSDPVFFESDDQACATQATVLSTAVGEMTWRMLLTGRWRCRRCGACVSWCPAKMYGTSFLFAPQNASHHYGNGGARCSHNQIGERKVPSVDPMSLVLREWRARGRSASFRSPVLATEATNATIVAMPVCANTARRSQRPCEPSLVRVSD
jgi:ferredoxin